MTSRERLASLLSCDMLELVDAYVRDVTRDVIREELAAAAVQSPRRWYTVKEAAERLAIRPEAVRQRAKRGRLVYRKQGRTMLIAVESVDGPGA